MDDSDQIVGGSFDQQQIIGGNPDVVPGGMKNVRIANKFDHLKIRVVLGKYLHGALTD